MTSGWPVQPGDLDRVLHSLITASLEGRIDVHTFLDEDGYPYPETPLGPEGYPLDSIELTDLAGRISRFFDLGALGIDDGLLRYKTLAGWRDLILRAWAEGIDRVTFETSGSTATAKPVTHRRADLLREIEALSALFSDRRRIVACTPCHHIYGFLFTVLLPPILDVPVCEGRHLSPAGMSKQLRAGDLIISHPFYWKYLSRSLPGFPNDVFGVTSTAPCPPETLTALGDLGLRRMTEVYGSTETGGIGYRTDPDDPYRLFDFWQPTETGLVATTGDPVVPPDHLHWVGNRHFRVERRRDGAVQVAGHNVFPAAVARIINEHPGVAACTVRLMNAGEGDRLKAFVVPASRVAGEHLTRLLYTYCEAELRPAERPRHITLGDALPRSSMGKAADWPIHEEN